MNKTVSSPVPGIVCAPTAEKLPRAGLLALAMTGFVAMLTEILPAGLLPQISEGLRVSDAMGGQLMTVFSLGSLLTAIPLTAATRGWRRRSVLLLAIIGFLIFNTVTALSTSYPLTLIARFLAGVAAGLAWGLLAGYARRMVNAPLQGQAMAIAMVGVPLALSLGMPLGTSVGTMVGWRCTFGIISGLTLALVFWVLLKVPDYPGQEADQRMPVREVFTTPGVRPVLIVILAWMLAHNILYTYIVPFLASAGLSSRVDVVLLVFGIASLLGIWLVGLLVNRWLRLLVMSSLGTFALVAAVLQIGGTVPIVVYLSVAVWGLTFGGAPTLLQTASADTAGKNSDVAQSMVVTAWNLAIAGGGLVGGLLLETNGVASFPWILLALLLAALVVVWLAKEHGFRLGPRDSTR